MDQMTAYTGSVILLFYYVHYMSQYVTVISLIMYDIEWASWSVFEIYCIRVK